MGKKYKLFLLVVTVVGLVLLAVLFARMSGADILNPAGMIAQKEYNLMVFAFALMMVIVIPVFVMTFMISWKYREGNKKKTKYSPNWDGNRLVESVWWGFPLLIIGILSVITWQSSHELDPFKPIESDTKPMTIQVVALQWKWLFIYPEEKIAAVNYVQFPEDTPVKFEITSSGPMNAFWIPRLGGQMYAMSGMSTSLHLIADEQGSFKGSSANISGEGFAGMKFTAKSTSQADFETWLDTPKNSLKELSMEEYDKLAKYSKNSPVSFYSDVEPGLYNKIVMKDMGQKDEKHPSDHIYTGDH